MMYDEDEPFEVTVSKCEGKDHTPEPRTVTIYSPDQLVYCDQGHRMHG